MVLRLLALALLLMAGPAHALDHEHRAWTELLGRHVHWNAEGTTTAVDYAGFAQDRAALNAYLAELSAVSAEQGAAFSADQRLAFLINAYNAYTVELILTRYPDLKSIKDLGTWLKSPWKQRFFSLLGEQRSLDDVEHGLIRGAPDYAEPRIHFAVNCASIGCPALRDEAFRAADLEAQLEDSTRRFLADRTRNRYDAQARSLELSSIFNWYRADFDRPWRGGNSLEAFVARYADALGLGPEDVRALTERQVRIGFLDYDWALNDGP